MIHGKIHHVIERPIGATVSDDVAVGATRISISDASDFYDRSGDLVAIDGSTYTIVAVGNMEGEVQDFVDVSPPLGSAVVGGTPVSILPMETEKTALIVIDDNFSGSIEVVVPHELRTVIPEGIRAEEEMESVGLEIQGQQYTIAEMGPRIPVMESKYLDITPVTEMDLEEINDRVAQAELAAQKGIDDAEAALEFAQTRNRVFRQNDKPGAEQGPFTSGDVWYDANDSNKPYIYDGTDFVSGRDLTIGRVYAQDTPPLAEVVARNLILNPEPTDPNYYVPSSTAVSDRTFVLNADGRSAARSTRKTTANYALYCGRAGQMGPVIAVPGKVYTVMYTLKCSMTTNAMVMHIGYGTGTANIQAIGMSHSLVAGEELKVRRTFTVPDSSAWNGQQLFLKPQWSTGPIGDYYDVSDTLWVEGDYQGPWFSGDSPSADGYVYAWEGTPKLSASVRALGGDDFGRSLWINTTDGKNTPNRWDGTAWVPATDKVATDAAQAAAQALSNANQAMDDAEEAFNAVTPVKEQVDNWKVPGTNDLDGAKLGGDSVKGSAVDPDAIGTRHRVTGALVQSNATPQRGIKFNDAALLGYDANGSVTFSLNAATGALGLKGSIQAGSIIEGAVISGTVSVVGGLLQTSATASRGVKITDSGLVAYDASGVVSFQIVGSTGAVVMKGSLTAGSDINGATFTGGLLQTIQEGNRGIKIQSSGMIAYSGSGVPTFSIAGDTGSVSLLGELKVGSSILGATITGTVSVVGGTLQTSATAARGIKITDNGMDAFDSNGAVTFQIVSATGAVSMKGTLTSGSTVTGAAIIGGLIQTALSTDGVNRTTINEQGLVIWDPNNVYRTWLNSNGNATFKGSLVVDGTARIGGSMIIEGTSTSYVYNGGQLISLGQTFGQAGVYALMSGGYLECGSWTPGTNPPKTKLRPASIEFEQTDGGRGFITSGNADELRFVSFANMTYEVPNGKNFVFRLGGTSSNFAIQTLNTATSGTALLASPSGILYRSASSRRYKDRIVNLEASEFPVLNAQEVTYYDRGEIERWHDPEPGFEEPTEPRRHVGVIAEQLVEVGLGALVMFDSEGRPDSVQYDKLAVLLLPVVRSQQAAIADLTERLERVELAGSSN